MFKRYAIAIIVFAVIAVSGVLYSRARPTAFTSAAWKSGDAKLRFRMKDSLLLVNSSGALPDRVAVDNALGPDDEPGIHPGYRYFRLTEWYGNPWYLRVRFDDDGKVEQFIVAPD